MLEVAVMTIKAIMLDIDGVLIVHPDVSGWSVDLERDLGISAATLQSAFFLPHWEDIVHGRASLRERLGPVLQELRPEVTCDALIDYWFREDAHVNAALLAEISAIRANGTEVHLATVQEHERAHYLWHALDFRNQFDGLHYAAELGCAKPAAGFYRSIEHRTGFAPQDLFFIDDKIANIEAARSCGWAAALWTGADPIGALAPLKQ
jgi:putative hydrolase of the HAD superfamily